MAASLLRGSAIVAMARPSAATALLRPQHRCYSHILTGQRVSACRQLVVGNPPAPVSFGLSSQCPLGRFIQISRFSVRPAAASSSSSGGFKFNKKPRPNRVPPTSRERSQTTLYYVLALAVATAGASYAAVPLYRVFCQSTGYGGTVQEGHDVDKVTSMKRKEDRVIEVRFCADTAATMQWNFRPQQPVIRVHPGETALAFYTARNPTDKPIDGISTYNVIPFEAGQYFNKIQCFCFEEQRLNPGEEVDMPVFFYLDPDYAEDPFLEKADTITLSYTFFESKPGLQLPTLPYHK